MALTISSLVDVAVGELLPVLAAGEVLLGESWLFIFVAHNLEVLLVPGSLSVLCGKRSWLFRSRRCRRSRAITAIFLCVPSCPLWLSFLLRAYKRSPYPSHSLHFPDLACLFHPFERVVNRRHHVGILLQVITHFGQFIPHLRGRQRQHQRLPEHPPDRFT